MPKLYSVSVHRLCYKLVSGFNRVVPAWFFRCRLFNVYELTRPDLSIRRVGLYDSINGSAINVRWCVTDDDFRQVESLTYFDRSYSTGTLAPCIAELNDVPAGGFWAATGQFDESELNLRIQLEPQQAWLFAARVDKPSRRRGVHSQMLQFMLAELSKSGFPEILVSVNPANVDSVRAHAKYAKARMGTVFALRFFRFSICFARGNTQCEHWYRFNARQNPIVIQCRI